MTEDRRATPGFADFLSEHFLWILGLAPFMVAALNILVLSGGDREVIGYLAANLNVTTLLIGAVVQLIPVIVWIFVFVDLVNRVIKRTNSPDKLSDEPSTQEPLGYRDYVFIMALIGVLFAGLLVLSIQALLGLVACGVILNSMLRHVRRRDRMRYGSNVPPRDYKATLVWLIPALAGGLIVAGVLTNSAWLPTEKVSLKDHAPVFGRVLSSDGEWTKFLDGMQNIQIVRTKDILVREPCRVVKPSYIEGRIHSPLFARAESFLHKTPLSFSSVAVHPHPDAIAQCPG